MPFDYFVSYRKTFKGLCFHLLTKLRKILTGQTELKSGFIREVF